MKSIFETLAVLSTGAVLLAGCGAAPVNATEVPAATEVKPSAAAAPGAPVENTTAGATAGAQTTQTPAAVATTTTAPATSAKPANAAGPATEHKKKGTAGAKKTGEQGSCGAGTCG